MAYGPPLFYLLFSLGGSLIDASEPVRRLWDTQYTSGQYASGQGTQYASGQGTQVASGLGGILGKLAATPVAGQLKPGVTPCVARNSECMTAWGSAQGSGEVATCEAFKLYDKCYRTNIQLCKQESGTSSSSASLSTNKEFTAEAQQFHTEYERSIAILPRGCRASIAPKDSSGSEDSSSSDIVMPTSVSSYASMPQSMRTRPVGSWSLYMTWWQWILLACCCCCCCLLAAGLAFCGGRKRNKGRYSYDDEDQWAQPQPIFLPPRVQSFHQAPQEVYPLIPQTQSYTYPQQASYAMPQGQGSFASPYQYSAAMPTAYNMGTQPGQYNMGAQQPTFY